jgi:hypothetical protein
MENNCIHITINNAASGCGNPKCIHNLNIEQIKAEINYNLEQKFKEIDEKAEIEKYNYYKIFYEEENTQNNTNSFQEFSKKIEEINTKSALLRKIFQDKADYDLQQKMNEIKEIKEKLEKKLEENLEEKFKKKLEELKRIKKTLL